MFVFFQHRFECFYRPLSVHHTVFSAEPDIVKPQPLVHSVRPHAGAAQTQQTCLPSDKTAETYAGSGLGFPRRNTKGPVFSHG